MNLNDSDVKSAAKKDKIKQPTNIYRFILLCIDPKINEYIKRLDKNVYHNLIPNPNLNTNGEPQRLRCVLCCWKCEKDGSNGNESHNREGKTATKLCITCGIPTLIDCNYVFHNRKNLSLPAFMNNALCSISIVERLVIYSQR